MDRTIVLYRTKYGYSKTYASWLSATLGCTVVNAEDAKEDSRKPGNSKSNGLKEGGQKADDLEISSLKSFHTVIYIAGIYVGKVNGFEEMTRTIACQFTNPETLNLILCTVGLTAEKELEYQESMLKTCKKIPHNQHWKCFHLRGGIDRNRVKAAHKLMISLVLSEARKKEALEEWQKDLLESSERKIDYSGKDQLQPVISYLQEQLKL